MATAQQLGTISAAELAAVVTELHGALVLYARQLCDWPEEIVQEAFLELQAAPSRPANVRAWLYRVVRNRAFNAARSDKRRKRHEQSYAQQRPWFTTQSAQRPEVTEAVEALEALDSDIRETVVARLWGNLTLDEIATLTSVSVATAQRRYVRGLEQLRQRLDPAHKSQSKVIRQS